ncbi:MAG: hypothetical protein ACTS40_01265 [Candidatus Hodgkinia cicadicola]
MRISFGNETNLQSGDINMVVSWTADVHFNKFTRRMVSFGRLVPLLPRKRGRGLIPKLMGNH